MIGKVQESHVTMEGYTTVMTSRVKSRVLPSLLTGIPDYTVADVGNVYEEYKNQRCCLNTSNSSDSVFSSSGFSSSSSRCSINTSVESSEGSDCLDDTTDSVDGSDFVDGPRICHENLLTQGILSDLTGKRLKKSACLEDKIASSCTVLRNRDIKVHLTPNPAIPEKILCLDGGGVKGIVEAVTLKYLQYALEQHHVCGSGDTVLQSLNEFIAEDYRALQEKEHDVFDDYDIIDNKVQQGDEITPQLHKIFDIITGTSTGSIIASAIARLHWKPDMLIKTSKEIAPIVFPKPSRWNFPARLKNSLVSGLSLFSNRFSRYSAAALEKYLEEKLGHVEWKKQDENEPKFGIVAINEASAQVHVFDSTKYKDSATVKVHEAVRASTAAPTYFPSFKIVDDISGTNTPTIFVDGGLAANCPANYTMNMMENYNLGCLVSVGCGDSEPARMPCTRVLQIAMNNKECWESFYNSHPREKKSLFRLTPSKESGIGSYDLADSHKVEEMEKAYVNSLYNNEEAIKRFKDASAGLFAKSIHVIAMECKQLNDEYQMEMVVKTTYNNREFQYFGSLPKDRQPQKLLIQRYQDGLQDPLVLETIYDPENDTIMLTYENVEIVGSPVKVVRKIVQRTKSLGM